MVMNCEDNISQNQSPSVTQATKARFHELLNTALSREIQNQPSIIRRKSGTTDEIISLTEAVPKTAPRQRYTSKAVTAADTDKQSDVDKIKSIQNVSCLNSSEESSGSHRVKRQVIAEVHSSRTHLIATSSDDDILADKKNKKRKKKSKWKQATECALQTKKEGQINKCFQLEEDEKSPSRLSNRSYIVDTPTFPVEEIKLLTTDTNIDCRQNELKLVDSPSRISNRSYVVETPSFPVGDAGDEQTVLPVIKTPIPLPRRKSLKSAFEGSEDILKSPSGQDLDTRSDQSETVTPHRGSDGDLRHAESVAVAKLQDTYTEDDGDYPLAVRKQKRKKKRHKRSKSREEFELHEFVSKDSTRRDDNLEDTFSHSTMKVDDSQTTEATVHEPGEQIVGVTIHGVDCPLVDTLVRHPVVRLYVIDTTTGEYFLKSNQKRHVCYYGEDTSYIQPIMTHPFDFKHHRSVIPQWEECLVLNESPSHLLTTNTLFLFELCDFVSASVASARYRTYGSAAGWHIIAWAFLLSRQRPLTEGKMRLQLYKPCKRPKNLHVLTPLVYEWWGSAARHKYPGCLNVTVGLLETVGPPPSPRLRSQLPTQAEQGSQASEQSASTLASEEQSEDDGRGLPQEDKAESVAWSRLSAQSCKVPNHRLHSLLVDSSMCLQFSGSGLWLACAKIDITLYNVPQYQLTATLKGHQGLIYSLQWSADNRLLLSASADCTVCVWRPTHRKSPLLQVLAHPSFTYSAQFLAVSGYCSVVTGCYDGIVRLWQGETHTTYQLVQEVIGHNGFVSAVCVSVNGTKVITGDSVGTVRICDVDDGSLSASRELRVREVRGFTINSLVPHPAGHRLLVHARNSCVYSVDLATGAVIQTFKGCQNTHLQTGMCLSPCGSIVFACSEDGSLIAWDGFTGAVRAVYCNLLPPGSASVHYHPHEHMLAVSALSQPPVHVLCFDRNATGEDISLTLFKSNISATDVIDTIKSLQSTNKWCKVTEKVIQKSAPSGVQKNKEENVKIIPKTNTNWPSLPQLKKSSEGKDLRLLEIIRRMDSIILAAQQSDQT